MSKRRRRSVKAVLYNSILEPVVMYTGVGMGVISVKLLVDLSTQTAAVNRKSYNKQSLTILVCFIMGIKIKH